MLCAKDKVIYTILKIAVDNTRLDYILTRCEKLEELML